MFRLHPDIHVAVKQLYEKVKCLSKKDDITLVPTLINKTLFVDENYGVDATAEKYNFDLPYKTINEAINNAEAGDIVHVRPGNYDERVLLKDQVNLYFEENTYLTSESEALYFSGNDENFKISIKGYLDIDTQNRSTNTAIVIQGEILDLDIEINSVKYATRGIAITANQDSKVNFLSKKDIHQTQSVLNRFININGSASSHTETWNFRWLGSMHSSSILSFTSNPTMKVNTYGNFYALPNISSLGFQTNPNAYWTHRGDVYSLDEYTNDPYGANSFSGLLNQTQGSYEVHGNIYSYNQPCFRPAFSSGNVKIYNSKIHCENALPIFNKIIANSDSKIEFINCEIRDGVGSSSNRLVETIDDTSSSFDTTHLIFRNCRFLKTNKTGLSGGIIYKNLPTVRSKNFFYNCEFICGSNQDLTETDSVVNGEFLFFSCIANADLGTDTSNLGSNLVLNNVNLI